MTEPISVEQRLAALERDHTELLERHDALQVDFSALVEAVAEAIDDEVDPLEAAHEEFVSERKMRKVGHA